MINPDENWDDVKEGLEAASFGGFAKITAEGWAEYDRAMAEWREKGRT